MQTPIINTRLMCEVTVVVLCVHVCMCVSACYQANCYSDCYISRILVSDSSSPGRLNYVSVHCNLILPSRPFDAAYFSRGLGKAN